ncbi:NADH:flavin oxidoreductase/NADH oxidase [Hydrogenophaga sp.]
MKTPTLFTPLSIRGVSLRNRIAMSPMCQYCASDGVADDWHLVHLGSRAVGGAGLVMVEATAVSPAGRISPGCLGLWNDAQIEPLSRIAQFIRDQGSIPAIQLSHSGRKGSCHPSWAGGAPLTSEQGAWPILSASDVRFRAGDPMPQPATEAELERCLEDFAAAAQRATLAGFDVVEIHAAHGYLLHQFLSPFSNKRTDGYGGSFENRTRFLGQVVTRVREVIPDDAPLFVRLSATDWIPGAWSLEDSTRLAGDLKLHGVDLIDVSSGGIAANAEIPLERGYQVPFSRHIRDNADILTAAVGLITDVDQAEDVVASGDADLVFLGRAFLRDPYWPLRAQATLMHEVYVPAPYRSAFATSR